MMRFAAVLALALPCATQAFAAETKNLIVNGGFERPALSDWFKLYPTKTSLEGWTIIGKPGDIAVVRGGFSQRGIVFQPAEGRNWLDLTGGTNTTTGIQQAVPTEIGKRYRLTFKVGNVIDALGPYGVRSSVTVRIDGVRVLTAVNGAGAPGAMAWKSYVVDFVAKTARTKIAFLNADNRLDNSNGLDLVILRPLAE